MPTARYLGIVRRHAGSETHSALRADILANAAFAVQHYVPSGRRADERRRWLETTWEQLGRAEACNDAQLGWARAVGGAAAHDDAGAAELTASSRATPWPPPASHSTRSCGGPGSALAATGHATVEDADAELRRDPTANGRTAHRTVLTARSDAAVRAAAWREAWEDETLTNDQLSATIAGIRAGQARELIAAFDEDYFARIRGVWEKRSIEISARLVRRLFPARELLDLVDAWLGQHEDAPAALRRIVVEQRDHLSRDLRVRAAQSAARTGDDDS